MHFSFYRRKHTYFAFFYENLYKGLTFWVASTDATHIFVWNWGSKMAAFPVMVPDFCVL